MLGFIKQKLYDFLTWSGIMLHMYRLVLQFLVKRLKSKPFKGNYQVIDDCGITIPATKYKGKIYPPFGEAQIASVAGATIRASDIMLCGFPKTGCHWVHEIMHMLVTGKAELTKYGKELGGMIDVMPPIVIDSLPSPRVLNSHMLYDDLPTQLKEKKTKIVWTVRAPKDAVVSHYNHTKNFYQYKGTFDSFFKLYIEGEIEYGNYYDHILLWEKAMKTQKDNPILVVEYEKLKANPLLIVKEIAQFLEVSSSDKFAEDIVLESNFKNMKMKRAGQLTEKLFRKGQVGDWRNWLTDEQSAAMDNVWKQRMANAMYQPEQ